MVRRSEFRVVVPRPQPAPTKRGRKPAAPPSFTVAHVSFGDGLLTGLHLSESGVYLADIDFNGIKHTLRVEQSYFITPVGDIIACAHHFPPPAPPKKKKTNKNAVEDSEPEELTTDGRGDAEKVKNSDADTEAA